MTPIEQHLLGSVSPGIIAGVQQEHMYESQQPLNEGLTKNGSSSSLVNSTNTYVVLQVNKGIITLLTLMLFFKLIKVST